MSYLKNKNWKPAFSWLDVGPEEHAFSFTVAKATEMDVLRTIREHTQKAIDEGQSFANFQKELEPKLQKLGWWGQQSRIDPLTGKAVDVQLGSPRRLKTIYWANTRTARAAGQWARIERTKKFLPFLQYRIGVSENHRLLHMAWDGMILAADDNWWDTHFPPNGWGCNCWVKQITARQAEKTGVSQSPKITYENFTNKRTGEVWRVPKGIDPGWQSNAGKLRAQSLAKFTMDKLPELPPKQATIAFKDLKDVIEKGLSGEFKEFVKPYLNGQLKPQGQRRIIGALSPALIEALDKQNLPPASGAIGISDKSILHMVRDAKAGRGAALTHEMIENLPKTLTNPKAVLFDAKDAALIFVEDIKGDSKAKIVTKINYRIKADKERRKAGQKTILVNEIITSGKVDIGDLKQKRYKLIKGRL